MMRKLPSGVIPMLAGPFIAVPSPPTQSWTHFANIRLGPGPKNDDQQFLTNSALEHVLHPRPSETIVAELVYYNLALSYII